MVSNYFHIRLTNYCTGHYSYALRNSGEFQRYAYYAYEQSLLTIYK